MGYKVEITIGLDGCKTVRASDFLPGLTIHKAPDCPPGMDYLNITHLTSGQAIAVHVQPGQVARVKEILSRVNWSLPPPAILESAVHKQAHEEAMRATNRDVSLRQENRIAKDTGGKRQPASGARWGARRDIILPRFLIEAKTTKHATFYLDVRDLAFLRKQAYSVGKVPVYIVEVSGKEELVILPFYDVPEEALASTTLRNFYWQAHTSVSITAAMALEAVHGSTFAFELACGKYVGLCYERFLTFARSQVTDD
jgi:hypothetical protein